MLLQVRIYSFSSAKPESTVYHLWFALQWHAAVDFKKQAVWDCFKAIPQIIDASYLAGAQCKASLSLRRVHTMAAEAVESLKIVLLHSSEPYVLWTKEPL